MFRSSGTDIMQQQTNNLHCVCGGYISAASELIFYVLIHVHLQVQLGFLMKGHTHEDIDAVFGNIRTWLQKNDARTLAGIMSVSFPAQLLSPACIACSIRTGWEGD